MLDKLGKTLAMLFALGCAVSVCGVFIMLHVTGIAAVVYPIVGVLFLATTCTNYRMTRYAVPKILNDIFGKKYLFQGLLEKEDGTPLSNFRRFLIGVSIVLALSVGATFGALNFTGGIVLGAIFSLGAASLIVPPISIFFSIVVLIVMTALMLYSMAMIIKTDNLWQVCKNTLFDLIDTDPDLPRNQNKSHKRIVVERVATLILLGVFLPLSVLGTIMTMMACTSSVGSVLLLIPHAIPTAVLYASNFITLFFGMLGQLPFVIRTSVISANEVFEQRQRQAVVAGENATLNTFLNVLFLVSRIINSIGNGILALLGTRNPAVAGLGFTGSAINNFAAAADDPPPEAGGNPNPGVPAFPPPFLPQAQPGIVDNEAMGFNGPVDFYPRGRASFKPPPFHEDYLPPYPKPQ